MPVLLTEKLKKFFLPSYTELDEDQQGYVVFDVSPKKAGDIEEVNTGFTSAQIMMVAVASRIREWNMTGEDGKVLDVNLETVKLLKMEDFDFLYDIIQNELDEPKEGLTSVEKKTSPSTSPDSVPVRVQTIDPPQNT